MWGVYVIGVEVGTIDYRWPLTLAFHLEQWNFRVAPSGESGSDHETIFKVRRGDAMHFSRMRGS